MSIAVYALPTKKLYDLKLEQIISPTNQQATFPFTCQLCDQTLVIDQTLVMDQLLTDQSIINQSIISQSPTEQLLTHSEKAQNNLLELVVFSDLTMNVFQQLLAKTNITLHAINAINHRNNAISYRFNVTTNNLETSRQQLAQLSITQGFEAALIYKAPKLSQPGVLVMDMDSTTIEIECIDEIAVLAGVGKQVAEVTELAMQGKLDFAQSLHQRVATLKNAPEQVLSDVAKNIPLMPGLQTLIRQLKQHHWHVAVASGGFTYFAEHLQQFLGLDAVFANKLEIVEGKLTGKVLGDVVDAQAKADSLNLLSKKYKVPFEQTLAMGDGANDLVMMEAANLGIAFHAKPIVLSQADSAINHQGLDCALHWLG